MTEAWRLRGLETFVFGVSLALGACSVDRLPLNPGTDSGRSDGGRTDSGIDAGLDAGHDAATHPDAAADSAITGDASDTDAGSIDAGDAGDASDATCAVDENCDARACFEANCANGICVYTPQPFGVATSEPQPTNDCRAVYCDGSGNTLTLADSMDPPLSDDEFCTLDGCSNTTPVHIPLQDGTRLPANAQVAGDCQAQRCTGGVTVSVADDQDVPTSTACQDGTCSAGVPGMTPRSAGLACGSGLVCDDGGDCIACAAQTASCTEDWQCCGGNCVGGQCGVACPALQADCDGMDVNGCETAINTVTNCGACGTGCALDHASETCAGGTCLLTACDANFANCNNDATDGCEQSLRSLTDCGVCGMACDRANASESCATGTCVLGNCQSGWGNCDSNPINGCEAPTNTLTDCGTCGTTCSFANATSTCASGTCQRIGCDAGFDDCDAQPANGCETALDTLSHCGACGNTCSGPSNRVVSCDVGVCNVGACVAGFQDCDGMADNGCEWNVSNGACPCVGTADSDGDGLTNCSEIDDGDPYTDPDIFNGAHVTHYPLCANGGVFGTTVACGNYDTLDGVTTCINQAPARQSLDQYSGWDWNDPAGTNNPINAAGFGFLPNWSGNNTSFQLDGQAFINITQAGRHCFQVNGNGGTGGSCGSLYLSTTEAGTFCGWSALPGDTAAIVQHLDGASCLQLTPGVYPFRWHFDRQASSMGDLHVDYCFGGNSNCSPNTAVPSSMLRATYASNCQIPADDCTQSTYNGHDYWFCNNALTWTAARAACQSAGMDIAIINSSAENTFFYNAITTDHWIGLSDSLSEGTWMWAPTYAPIWANGSTIPGSYVNWSNNEPNGGDTRDCAEMISDTGRWNDTTCTTAQAFICEEP